jgi:hypothetical protein
VAAQPRPASPPPRLKVRARKDTVRQIRLKRPRPGVVEPSLFLAQMRHRRSSAGAARTVFCGFAAETADACSTRSPRRSRLAQCGQPWASTRSWLAAPSASSPRPAFLLRPGAKSAVPPALSSSPPPQGPATRPCAAPRSAPLSPQAKPKTPQPSSNHLRDPTSLINTNS